MNVDYIVERNILCRLRKIRKSYVLIGVSKCFETNDMGKKIWDSIDGRHTVKDVIDKIVQEYAVDYSIVEKDVLDFIEILIAVNAVKVVN